MNQNITSSENFQTPSFLIWVIRKYENSESENLRIGLRVFRGLYLRGFGYWYSGKRKTRNWRNLEKISP